MENYDDLIREVIKPEIMETHFVKQLSQLENLFTKDTKMTGGKVITVPIRTSVTSNAAAYTKADVDPVAGTFTSVDATWNKV
ncbi:MAG: hypothetical protein GY835_19650 [bacterium]|nr:hypothetical protein [bacterium]